MPSVVIKAAPDRDFYVLWTTVTDGPIFTGTRAEMADVLKSGVYNTGSHSIRDVQERLDRADHAGSSAIPPWRVGHWSNGGLMVNWDHLGEQEIGRRYLPRDHLAEWLTTGDETLTEPTDL